MISRILKKLKSDRGDTLVSMLLVVFPMIVCAISLLDFHVYNTNSTVMTSLAKSGADSVASFGSTKAEDVPEVYTKVSYEQGGMKGACDGIGKKKFPDAVASKPVECGVLNSIANADGHGMVNIDVNKVACGPDQSTGVGSTMWCQIDWTYGSFPLSFLSLQNAIEGEETVQRTCATAGSEVKLAKGESSTTEMCGGKNK